MIDYIDFKVRIYLIFIFWVSLLLSKLLFVIYYHTFIKFSFSLFFIFIQSLHELIVNFLLLSLSLLVALTKIGRPKQLNLPTLLILCRLIIWDHTQKILWAKSKLVLLSENRLIRVKVLLIDTALTKIKSLKLFILVL